MRKTKKILFIIILSLFFSLSLLLLNGCGGAANVPATPPSSPVPSSPSTTPIPTPETPTPVPTQTINPPGASGGDGPIINVVPPNL